MWIHRIGWVSEHTLSNGDNGSFLLYDLGLCLGRLALNLVLILLLLCLVFGLILLSEESTEDGGTLARYGARLGLGLFSLLLLVGRAARG
jgi:hypothetical protein